jgi:hypothetical protein
LPAAAAGAAGTIPIPAVAAASTMTAPTPRHFKVATLVRPKPGARRGRPEALDSEVAVTAALLIRLSGEPVNIT